MSQDYSLEDVCEFNFFANRYIHLSWLKKLPSGRIISKLRYCKRTESRISDYILEKFSLQDKYWFDFEVPLTRVALWPSAQLEKLALYAGLAIYSRCIQHGVLQDQVLRYKESIGEDAYCFALKRAPFLIQNDMLADDLVPEVDLRTAAVISGVRCMGEVYGDHSLALSKRMLMKLPYDWVRYFTEPGDLNPDHCTYLLAKLMNEIQREMVEPEEYDVDEEAEFSH